MSKAGGINGGAKYDAEKVSALTPEKRRVIFGMRLFRITKVRGDLRYGHIEKCAALVKIQFSKTARIGALGIGPFALTFTGRLLQKQKNSAWLVGKLC